MSHAASIYVYTSAFHNLSIPEIIEIYISNGWNLNDFGHISLRPLGDKDDFNWIELELNQVDELFEIIMQKVKANEDPAVVLMLDETEIGATATFSPEKELIWFHLLINTKRLPILTEWTDLSWYLPYMTIPLSKNGVGPYQIETLEAL